MQPRSLILTDLVKSYDRRTNAVDHIDLRIEAGEFVSFLGPSGSGKTTTLMMIAGFEQPTSGEIKLDGRAIEQVPPYDRNIGMVFQNYALFPHMTVRGNVGYPLRIRQVAKDEMRQRVDKALTMVGLSTFGDRYPAELSGGQQQRVALARALVFEPGLILLDEPLGALDKNLREHMQVELKRIHKELGVTMIYVTHDQTEAMTMSDRIAVFNAGRIEHLGTPTEVYFKPRTRFVASFVGDSNLLEGTAGQGGVVEIPGFGPVATAATELPAGSPALLLMRPEIFEVVADGEGASVTANRLQVVDVVNYGDSLLLIGKAGEQSLRVRVPSRVAAGYEAGGQYGIRWNPANVQVVGS
ncbi:MULTISPECIES: ABC transporter ATP-binding protein [unclassified Chelatococcus]|uniref:ABC transporter ATP-binding protein n=1 Tax=unclassified Chelatococcus TaxID=2638111 RepID=UPI001BCB0440|nr:MULTISPECIES: ABC transporter ATP-binding protein [unclassified Chelatococcus]MBS7696655.1 ABC transporter ATP-binding protein [Chelatococcus sp. YT9]MBX3555220.1 ABC transporter ATP-binding protein [Chelatococcus sp.]